MQSAKLVAISLISTAAFTALAVFGEGGALVGGGIADSAGDAQMGLWELGQDACAVEVDVAAPGDAGVGVGGSHCSRFRSQSLAAKQLGRENCFVFSSQDSHKQRRPAASVCESASRV